MRWLASVEKQTGKRFLVLLGFLFVPLIGFLDYLTGQEIAFSIFYLVPVSLVAWLAGRAAGSVASVLAALTCLFAELASGHTHSRPGIFLWNAFILLVFFVVVALLLAALRRSLEHERELVRVDNLTGALSSRFFRTLIEMEVARSRRSGHPFTIAYLDIDDFKSVNDRFGHSAGDRLLRGVAQYARRTLRGTDVVARLGGDEFAILFPETSPEAARAILKKVMDGLLTEMQKNQRPVTFSIGALTCAGALVTTDEIIGRVDELMYSVKRGGKNGIAHVTWDGRSEDES